MVSRRRPPADADADADADVRWYYSTVFNQL
jgi:hypothetical protein